MDTHESPRFACASGPYARAMTISLTPTIGLLYNGSGRSLSAFISGERAGTAGPTQRAMTYKRAAIVMLYVGLLALAFLVVGPRCVP